MLKLDKTGVFGKRKEDYIIQVSQQQRRFDIKYMKKSKCKCLILIGIIIAIILFIFFTAIKKDELKGTIYSKENGLSIIVDETEKDFFKGYPGQKRQIIEVSVPADVNLEDYEVGDHICIEYDGGVLESYPAQIIADSIRKD